MIQLRRYAYLMKQLTITDFKLKYQRSILGYMWSLVKPLAFFLVLYFVFTKIFKLGNSIPNYINYLFVGTILWGFFTEATTIGMYSIAARGDLIKKVSFPRILLVISGLLNSVLTFSLNSIVLLVFLLIMGNNIGPYSLFVIPLVLELFILITGVSLILTSLYVKYRDISHIWEIAMQIGFYATPIIYPLSVAPANLQKLIMLSPVAQVMQDFRFVVVTDKTIRAIDVLGPYTFIPYTLPFLILGCGLFLFNKRVNSFAEEI